MEAVGRLAGGMAHDFNNLLTAIIGYTQLAQLRLGNHAVQKEIGEIEKAAQRATTLTQQLLAFSRKHVLQPKVINLNAITTDISKMIGRLIGEDIELTTRLADDLGWIRADPNQMEQILLNLAVNARDAMPTGGKLIIETANYQFNESDVSHHLEMSPGAYVMLAVSDTGSGMDKTTLQHIFEPFFTTKEVGKGTGLGLSMVYGIVRQSGGTIWAYSEPGRGTTFKIYMPRADETSTVTGTVNQLSNQLTGSETILLVEDEAAVRDTAAQILQLQGYSVMQAADADEAMRICETFVHEIHLVVSDVVMPRVSGRQLVERLRRLRPQIKVLYISGYTDDAIIHHGIVGGEMPFLQKPFTKDALARKVREVLDRK
jgi:CheY-like chemotaxis protein